MPENRTTEALLQLLSGLPVATCGYRIDPATGRSEWIYCSPQMAAVYGLSEAEVGDEPFSLMQRMVPEDAASLQQQMGKSLETLAPMLWRGRIVSTTGVIRTIETKSTFERGPDGMITSYGVAIDVTEQTAFEQALSASEAAHRRESTLHQTVIEALPVGVAVMEADGTFTIFNRAAKKYVGPPPTDYGNDLTHAFGVFETDGVTPLPNEKLPLIRALAGEEAPEVEAIIRNAAIAGEVWMQACATPIRDEAGKVIAAMAAFQDVTAQRRLEEELRRRNEQLAASEEAKSVLIERLRFAIDELSNPILEIWDDVLAMPLIGVIDSRRIADMVKRLLAEVARTQASFVIVDLTGVELVDTKTADHLMKLVRKVEVVGARCVLTGIRPAVSETLVDIGVDFSSLSTLRNLKHGLREALRSARREREGLRDSDPETALEAAPRRPGR